MAWTRLVGSHEIRKMLGGISRQRTYSITGKPDFPRPIRALRSGRIWDANEVEAWIAGNPRLLVASLHDHPGEDGW